MRENENFIALPPSLTGDRQIDLSGCADIECAPGVVCVAFDGERKNHGLIQLPDETKGRLRPDSGTVVSVGPGVKSVHVGDRVLTRPYHGIWLDNLTCKSGFEIENVRFYGLTWGLEHSLLMKLDKGNWMPLYDWALLVRAERESEILIANPGSKPKPSRAFVAHAGKGCDFGDGVDVVLDGHPNIGLKFQFGMDGYELVKQMDEDGNQRIWAVLERTA